MPKGVTTMLLVWFFAAVKMQINSKICSPIVGVKITSFSQKLKFVCANSTRSVKIVAFDFCHLKLNFADILFVNNNTSGPMRTLHHPWGLLLKYSWNIDLNFQLVISRPNCQLWKSFLTSSNREFQGNFENVLTFH